MNTFYGERLAIVKDFAGNHWSIASRIEDVTLEEVQMRVSGFNGQPAIITPKLEDRSRGGDGSQGGL